VVGPNPYVAFELGYRPLPFLELSAVFRYFCKTLR